MSEDDDDAPAMPVPEHGLPAGTPVLTPTGEQPVEALAPGDLVIAVSGQGAPFQRILEIRRAVVPAALVRLRAGALAEGAPREDLLLPTGQALLVDGVLVRAGALLGGPGAVLEQQAGLCEVFGIVLAGHDAVLAAGTPIETAPPGPDAPAFAPRAGAEARLRAIPGVDTVDRRGQEFTVRGRDAGLVTHVIQRLAADRIHVTDFRTVFPTLEDVFLALTGHSIRD